MLILACLADRGTAQGRTTVVGRSAVYRYSGDTLWAERDSTVRRSIFRGDTIFAERTVNGVRQSAMTAVVTGDSADIIFQDSRDPSVPPLAKRVWAPSLTFDHSGLVGALQQLSSQRPVGRSSISAAPSNPVRYCVDYAREAVHHLDTVRYLYRHSATRVDTTMFLLVGDTTVRRVSPSPRTFGHAMVATLMSEMDLSAVRERIAPRAEAPLVPRVALVGCDRRRAEAAGRRYP